MTDTTADIELDFSGESKAAAMTPSEAKARMETLAADLERWNTEYYVLDQPSVPDAEYREFRGQK